MATDNRLLRQVPSGVWVLGFVSLLMDISSELIHSLLPLFLVTGLGANMLMLGLIEGAAEAAATFVKVFSGALSDYWGRRKPLALLGYSLGALSKPLFALASTANFVFTARLIDRLGKGIRGAPRDALIADLTPRHLHGAAYGLRQALDAVGAFLGPVLAVVLMLILSNDFRAVFWFATVPAVLCLGLLIFGVKEPAKAQHHERRNPISRKQLRTLSASYWYVVVLGAFFTLARFSEAFLIMRAQTGGLDLAWTPLVLIVMNLAYACFAYPFGALSDTWSHNSLLALGLLVLMGADVLLASSNHGPALWIGVGLWGLHMALTQGLLSSMVANTAPAALRGTAFGFFNLCSGVTILLASVLAGWLWHGFGPEATFTCGAWISATTLIIVLARPYVLASASSDQHPK